MLCRNRGRMREGAGKGGRGQEGCRRRREEGGSRRKREEGGEGEGKEERRGRRGREEAGGEFYHWIPQCIFCMQYVNMRIQADQLLGLHLLPGVPECSLCLPLGSQHLLPCLLSPLHFIVHVLGRRRGRGGGRGEGLEEEGEDGEKREEEEE